MPETIIRLENGGELNLGKIGAKLEGEWVVGFSAPHASPVEFGTMPHFPPVEPLIGWAQRKLGLRPDEAKRVGHAIAWKIFRHGTDPQPYFRPAIDETVPQVGSLLNKGLDLGDIADLILQRAQDNIVRKGISDEGALLGSGFSRRVE